MMSFLQTGKALYVLAAICLAGVFTRLMAGSFYKRLIKESTNTVSYTHLDVYKRQEYEVYLRRIAYVNDIPVDYIEDVVQDTFVSYARYKYSLDMSEESKRALLIRILKSRCMDFHRRMKYRSYGELEMCIRDRPGGIVQADHFSRRRHEYPHSLG